MATVAIDPWAHVPRMAKVPEAPNRLTPARERGQLKRLRRKQRRSRAKAKKGCASTELRPQNAIVPLGGGQAAFLREMEERSRSAQEQSEAPPAAAPNPFIPAAALSQRPATPELQEMLEEFQGLDDESRAEIEAEMHEVRRLSEELVELPEWDASQIDEQLQAEQAEAWSRQAAAEEELRDEYGRPVSGERPSSKEGLKWYKVKRPLASPNATNVDMVKSSGRNSQGLSWVEFSEGRAPESSRLHSRERQQERQRATELESSWHTIPIGPAVTGGGHASEWTGPCSVPPLALPMMSQIGRTRVADTIRQPFKGQTISREARTPRTANWQAAMLSQYELALRDGPARACTAKEAPGVPALNSRPVALGAYHDRFWAGPSVSGREKQTEVSMRRAKAVSAGRKEWSNMNRPPPVERKKQTAKLEPILSDADANDEAIPRFESCSVWADIPEHLDEHKLTEIFSQCGDVLQATTGNDPMRSGACCFVTFAEPEAVPKALSSDTRLKETPTSLVIHPKEVVVSKLRPQGILGNIFPTALSKAKIGFSKMDTEALQSAGLIVEVVEAVGLPAMDLCGLSDPYCDIKLGDLHRKTAVCKHTKDPKWKQQFALPVPLDKVDTAELVIDVVDEDVGDDDDFMGRIIVKVADLKPEWSDRWYVLDDQEVGWASESYERPQDYDADMENDDAPKVRHHSGSQYRTELSRTRCHCVLNPSWVPVGVLVLSACSAELAGTAGGTGVRPFRQADLFQT